MAPIIPLSVAVTPYLNFISMENSSPRQITALTDAAQMHQIDVHDAPQSNVP